MFLFLFNVTATYEIYTHGHTLSLHDARPISFGFDVFRRNAIVGNFKRGGAHDGRLAYGVALDYPLPLHAQHGSQAQRFRSIGSHERRDSGRRSEEHTSELQSLMRISYAVFCLKKKHK